MGAISVAMATLNGVDYLGDQLDSIARQTRRPDELVICDDGSTDGTIDLIKNFARSAPFSVRLFENSARLGYRKNFIQAASLCQGELISFCDQDDVWQRSRLNRMAAAFDNPDVLLAFHNATVVDGRRAPIGQTFKFSKKRVYAPLELPPWTIVPGFSQVFRRSLLQHVDLHDQSVDMYCTTEPMPHDQWFLFVASLLGSIVYVPDRLAQYRQHGLNCSGWLPSRPLAYALHSVTHARYYAQSALIAVENRLSLLTQLQRERHEPEKIQAAVDHYLAIKRYAELRMQLYTSKSLRRRARSIVSLLKDRAYTESRAKLGLDNLLLDMCVGLTVGPALRNA
jgi:hypothetical protein